MSQTGKWAIGIIGALVAMALIVSAVLFGQHGVEVASWMAGIGSFLVTVATLFLTVSPSSGRGQRFKAKASGSGQVFQAGKDISNAGNNRPPKS